jgi:hypothetical protein
VVSTPEQDDVKRRQRAQQVALFRYQLICLAVRVLTNHEMDSGAPFAALLVGQPTLRQRLRLGVLAALDQRISVRYALAGISALDEADAAPIAESRGRLPLASRSWSTVQPRWYTVAARRCSLAVLLAVAMRITSPA